MVEDIFDYWKPVGPDDLVHPADKEVFDRIKHPFDLKCLPSCVWGQLRTAPVILLYLSPGLADSDHAAAQSSDNRQYYVQRRDGRAPLSRDNSPSAGLSWIKARTNFIGRDWREINNAVAILNIGAYHSKDVPDISALASLPSSRATLDWAQGSLFPGAVSGDRIVICMRSARLWGLTPGCSYGKGLFCPNVNRAGYMLNDGLRIQIVAAVEEKLTPLLA